MTDRPSVILGVTADVSVVLMRGLPAFLAGRGWDVHVVSTAGPHLEALRSEPGVTTHAVAMERQPSPIADLRALIHWVSLVRRIRPSAVAVGTPKAGLLGGIAGWVNRVPRRVYLLRGLRLETVSGTGGLLLSTMERVSAAVAHNVVAVSPSLAERFVELRLARRSKVVVLGAGSSNGIDVEAHSVNRLPPGVLQNLRRELRLDSSLPVIGFVGRLSRDKGLHVLATAAAALTEQGVDLHLLVVGDLDAGEDPIILDQLRASVARLSIVGHVDDPRPYYHLMDILCLPTYREGFPNVVLEAAASSVPTVTTTATGAVDAVVDGETGLTVEVGSSEALAAGLRSLIDDTALRQEYGRSAFSRAQRSFDRTDVWERFELFLREGKAPIGR